MSDLQDAVYEIAASMREVSGVKNAPNEPPENTENFPFVAVFPGTGEIEALARGDKKGLHNIDIELHVKRKDLPIDMRVATPFIDKIADQILSDRQNNNYTHINTFGAITYEFAPLAWGATQTLGYRVTVNNVKLRGTIT